jgi:hypothetical protein
MNKLHPDLVQFVSLIERNAVNPWAAGSGKRSAAAAYFGEELIVGLYPVV